MGTSEFSFSSRRNYPNENSPLKKRNIPQILKCLYCSADLLLALTSIIPQASCHVGLNAYNFKEIHIYWVCIHIIFPNKGAQWNKPGNCWSNLGHLLLVCPSSGTGILGVKVWGHLRRAVAATGFSGKHLRGKWWSSKVGELDCLRQPALPSLAEVLPP